MVSMSYFHYAIIINTARPIRGVIIVNTLLRGVVSILDLYISQPRLLRAWSQIYHDATGIYRASSTSYSSLSALNNFVVSKYAQVLIQKINTLICIKKRLLIEDKSREETLVGTPKGTYHW